MRFVFALVAVLALSGSAVPQTLLGNCGGNDVQVQRSTNNVYCMPPSSPCGAGALNLTDACNLLYFVGGIF